VKVLHDPRRRGFVSDNCAGVHPEVMAALQEADGGHQASYGADVYTERLREVVRAELGEAAEVLPVFNGTGANILALELLADRGDAVVCAEDAHLSTAEAAAPELHGLKLLPMPSPHGLIDPQALRTFVTGLSANRGRPGVLSITQSTELGTCYSLEQLRALTAEAHALGMRVHLDGARLANAAAHLGAGLRDLTGSADVVSLGASKNGGMFGEGVLVRDAASARNQRLLHKAVTQLPSKTRFVSAQLLALFEGDLWVRNGAAANRAARRLSDALEQLPSVRVVHPVHANAVFAELPEPALVRLRERYAMGSWHETPGVARFMTAYDTTDADVDALVGVLAGAEAR
jgi:threonine aldolase